MNCLLCNAEINFYSLDKESTYLSAFCSTDYCSYLVFSDDFPYNEISEYNFDLTIGDTRYYISCHNGKYLKSEPKLQISIDESKILLNKNIWVPPDEIISYVNRIIRLKAFL